MQDGISHDELAQAMAAFTILSVLQFGLIIYTYRQERRALLPPFAWAVLVITWAALLVSGSVFTVVIIATREHGHPWAPYVRWLLLGLKCAASLTLEVFLVVVIDWRIYWDIRVILPRWLDVLIGAGIVFHLLIAGLGVWQLTLRGPEFVWAAPVPLHLIVPGLAYAIHRGTTTLRPSDRIWLVSWGIVNVVVSAVSIVAAGVQGGWLHLAQCLLGMASVWVFVWKRWRGLRKREKPRRSASYSTVYSAIDLRVPPRRKASSTIGGRTVCISPMDMGGKELEGGNQARTWGGGYDSSETMDRPSMEAWPSVMQPPRAHVCATEGWYEHPSDTTRGLWKLLRRY